MTNYQIDDQLLRQRIKIILRNEGDFDESIKIVTGMNWQEEEALVETVWYPTLLELSDKEIAELTRRIIEMIHEYIPDHRDSGYIKLHAIEELVGDRYAAKYLKSHSTITLNDSRQSFDCSEEAAAKIKRLLLSLQPTIPEGQYYKLDSLIERLTGERSDLMKAVWQKYGV